MNLKKSKPGKKTRNQWVRRWHRRVGKTSLVLVLILCITGIFLNRTESLRLDDKKIENSAIAKLYGLSPSSIPTHFKAGKHMVSWLEGRLYLDQVLIENHMPQVLGAVYLNDIILVASGQQVSLFLNDGSLIEHIKGDFLPDVVKRMGRHGQDSLILETPTGLQYSDSGLSQWQAFTGNSLQIKWSEQSQASASFTKAILDNPAGQGVSYYRLLLDLHTGRIVGPWGPYIMDFAALALIFLGISGLVNNSKKTNGTRKNKQS